MKLEAFYVFLRDMPRIGCLAVYRVNTRYVLTNITQRPFDYRDNQLPSLRSMEAHVPDSTTKTRYELDYTSILHIYSTRPPAQVYLSNSCATKNHALSPRAAAANILA